MGSTDSVLSSRADLEPKGKNLRDTWQMLRRRRWSISLASATIFAIGVGIAMFWPPVYRSKATILIEEQEIPPDLVRSAITSYADQRIETIKQQVMSRATLWKIIEQYNLYDS